MREIIRGTIVTTKKEKKKTIKKKTVTSIEAFIQIIVIVCEVS